MYLHSCFMLVIDFHKKKISSILTIEINSISSHEILDDFLKKNNRLEIIYLCIRKLSHLWQMTLIGTSHVST